MLEFIQQLRQRYQTVLSHLDRHAPLRLDYPLIIDQLLFAEAACRKTQLLQSQPEFPLQVAVIGPTQAGKSTVVNCLLGLQQAVVSPLAGYTVHPQGYCHTLQPSACHGLQQLFGRFQCLTQEQLRRERLDCYSLDSTASTSRLLPACVCWDTPDFDSIDAADYREGLIRTLALADIVVVVVSKEKYADRSVWTLLSDLQALQQPTLLVLNKVNRDSEAQLIQSLQDKWMQYRQDAVPNIVCLPFDKSQPLPQWPASQQKLLMQLATQVQRGKHSLRLQHYLHGHWADWLAPVLAEHAAHQQWQATVDAALAEALQHYRRDYLNHPHHYHTFQQALLNVLKLLEIPGMARWMTQTRRVMTWPVRKLMHWQAQGTAVGDQESRVLMQLGEHVLIQLADQLLEKTETDAQPQAWWKATAVLLRQQKAALLMQYQQAVVDYQQHFEQDIDAAAQRLYHTLQRHPALLNSLRATRATTDLAALVLALQTGGLGVHDVVLTPLMLSISSLLAESAIGSHLQRVQTELKQQQAQAVKQQLLQGCLQTQLLALPYHRQSHCCFGISERQLQQAEQLLHEKKHGLRHL